MTEDELKEKFNPLKGRIHRLEYLGYIMMLKALDSLSSWILSDQSVAYYLPVLLVFFGLAAYLTFCAVAKRLRDIGVSGKWSFLIVPIAVFGQALMVGGANAVNIIALALAVIPALALLSIPPQKKDNKYGIYNPAQRII